MNFNETYYEWSLPKYLTWVQFSTKSLQFNEVKGHQRILSSQAYYYAPLQCSCYQVAVQMAGVQIQDQTCMGFFRPPLSSSQAVHVKWCLRIGKWDLYNPCLATSCDRAAPQTTVEGKKRHGTGRDGTHAVNRLHKLRVSRRLRWCKRWDVWKLSCSANVIAKICRRCIQQCDC